MKKIFYMIGLSLMVTSCDFLEQEPTTQIPAGGITTVDDLDTAVNGIYYIASYGDSGTLASEAAIYADLKSGDTRQIGTSSQIASRVAKGQITASDSYSFYYYLYVALANVNVALESAVHIDDPDAEFYIAELYALRGWLHFELARLFAPIPTSGSSNTMGIVLSDRVFEIDYRGARASLEDTYKQIVDDLTTAIETEDPYFEYPNLGHINYWSALGMRARAYLYWGKYEKALEDCKEIIENSPYSLYSLEEYASVWGSPETSEMMFEILQTDDYNAQRYAPGYYMNPNGYAECAMTDEFYAFISADDKDVRKDLVKSLTSSSGGNPGYYPLKYPGNIGASTPMYTNNIKIMRLSEIYLIAAEAALQSGSATDAAEYINTLRENRIEDYSEVATVTLDDILNERRKELFGENHMAFDCWRNKRSSGSFDYTDYRTVLPIPIEELYIAGGLLVQNPGY
ncbi:MAG: RagB/SusD family nutrient uptake outer membrane protein [Alistipes sp.]|nr:RagB/SusD family nutrient uptake outer membrane protein [Alistipes sp.]